MTHSGSLLRLGPVLAVLLGACVDSEPAAITSPISEAVSANDNASRCVLNVSAKAKGTGDGSQKAPFTDLRVAIAVAAKAPCDGSPTIELGPGAYALGDKPVLIAAPLSIEGKGNPTITGMFLVRTKGKVAFSHLAISAGPQKDVAALFVDGGKDPNGGGEFHAEIYLSHVTFFETLGFGIYQVGGTLTAERLEMDDIGAAFNPASGTAVFLAGGAQATLNGAVMQRNVHGLLATGAGTSVVATNLVTISSSGIHPASIARIGAGDCSGISGLHLGAVEFTDHARGTGRSWALSGNGVIGLYAHDLASVDVTGLEVAASSGVAGPDGGSPCGGFGVGSLYGGQIEITGFTINGSSRCGVIVAGTETTDPALIAATALDLHEGVVDHAPVGACVAIPGYDTERLHDNVEYRDVEVPLQATSYGLPDEVP